MNTILSRLANASPEVSIKAGEVQAVAADGVVLSMRLVGANAPGELADRKLIYRDALVGADVQLQPMVGGVKEDVVLRGPGSSRELVYRLESATPVVEIEPDRLGGLVVRRAGEVALRVPRPFVVDARHEVSFRARFELKQAKPGEWVVRVVLDEEWLDEKRRAWPVTVDPTVVPSRSSATDDCVNFIGYDARPSFWNAFYCNVFASRFIGTLLVDPVNRYGQHSYGLLRFNSFTTTQADAIDSATLKVNRLAYDGGQYLDVHRVSTHWTASASPTPLNSSAWYEEAPEARLVPGRLGAIEGDLTSLVTQWRRFEMSGGASGAPNYGVVLRQISPKPFWACFSASCGSTTIGSSQASDPAQRPVLEVGYFPSAPVGNAVISPREGELTAKRVPLQARALDASAESVRFQYIAGSQRRWTDIPVSALKTPTRGSVSSVDIPVNGNQQSDVVIWDLSATPGGDVDGPVHVRAWIEASVPSEEGMTDEVNFRLDRRGIDKSPSVPIGPGSVNLLSGEFTMTETDASAEAFLQDLSFTRTYRSRGVAVRNADMFGSGWEANVQADGGELPYKGIYNWSEVKEEVVERQFLNPEAWNWELFFETFAVEDLQADIETFQEVERYDYEYAAVEAADGTKMTFTQVKDPSGRVTGWTPDDEHPGFALRRDATRTAGVFDFTLTDPSGSTAIFRSEAASSPNYRLQTFKQPGSPSALSYEYESAGTRQRLKRVIAPTPPGGTARSLVFTWGEVGTARVPRVIAVALDDGQATTVLTSYGYDAEARLSVAIDAQIPGGVRYTYYQYDARGRMQYVAPTGEEPWAFSFTTSPGDSGPRLQQVGRAHPDGGIATRTIVYDVPLTGAGAPYDMSTTETARWGQTTDLPWDAVAIWPEDTLPGAGSPDYRKATVFYVGVHGRTVNVARPGGAISTSRYDAAGNVIRSLNAQGRAVALGAGASSAQVAEERSTLYTYRGGVDLVAVKEPVTQITLSDGRVVTGRRVNVTNYDENAPSTREAYHLPTSEWRHVEVGNDIHDRRELVRYEYDGLGGMSGWTARQATKTTVDPGGRALVSHSILHGTYPLVEETRTPGAPVPSSMPDVQWHQYYGIAPTNVPAGIQDAQCRAFARYASGRLCMRSENMAPNAQVQRRWYTYTRYGHIATLNESRTMSQSGSTFRSTISSYDDADQLTTVETTGGAGTATPTMTYTYDPATGRQIHARSSAGGAITRAFDRNGRLTSYTDASGSVTTYRYDLRGREASMTIDTSTTTYGYDDRDNRTVVDDPAVGNEITASYDLEDRLAAEAMPNGLVLAQTYDETGRPALLWWTQTSGCSSGCVRARSEITNRDPDGRTVGQRTNATQETLTYDTAGRLTRSDAVRLSDNRCVRSSYQYDGGGSGDSNRTSSSVWSSRAGDACGTGTPTTRTLTYNAADRITSTGWVWDDFGRATSVPAADSGGSGTLTASYFTDDRVRAMTLDSRTHTYGRDPLRRTKTVASSGAGKPTVTNYWLYSDDSDKPTRISDTTNTTRDVEGPSGLIVASNTNGTLTYQLRDIQGSIIATASAAGTITAGTEYDPFGTVITGTPNVIDWTNGLPANGWLGAHQRPTQFGQQAVGAAGPIEMGVRVYLPRIGRFLQVDPVDGGSANAYDYAWQDPVNDSDLSGLKSCAQIWRDYERNHRTPIPLHCNANRPGPLSVKKAFNAVKFVVHVGACVYKLAKSRGVDATSCNQF